MMKLLNRFLNAPRPIKRLISVVYDVIAISIAFFSAYVLRLSDFEFHIGTAELACLGVTICISIAVFIRMGLYRAILRYIPPQAAFTIIIGIAASSFAMIASGFYLHAFLPRSVPIIYALIALLLIGLPRLIFRNLLHFFTPKGDTNVLIYGAGEAGHYLVSQLQKSGQFRTVGFIDNNPKLRNSQLRGVRVYGPQDIGQLVKKYKVTKTLLALDKSTPQLRKQIVRQFEGLGVKIQSIPPLNEMINGKALFNEFRSIQIEDLLGRDAVAPIEELLTTNIKQKVVMVTGAGGSIGSEICRQIISIKPTALILFERNEFNLYNILEELTPACNDKNIKLYPILGSTNNGALLENTMKTFHVDTLYHAAAYKHVPLVEFNVIEATQNNLFGTIKAVKAALNAKVKHFVLISSDKAVRPTNVMGATKRLAELVLQAHAKEQSNTIFSMVRFGNVLDSSGSVVPKFKQQISLGGPITVTHPDITRYFMTMQEAAQLVIQAGAMAKGGEVFVLEMGEPVKILHLAKEMAYLSGYTIKSDENPDGDIEIKITGLRPGEKLFEELLVGSNCEGTPHPRIMRAEEASISIQALDSLLNNLQEQMDNGNTTAVIKLLQNPIIGLITQKETSDLLFSAKQSNVIALKPKT